MRRLLAWSCGTSILLLAGCAGGSHPGLPALTASPTDTGAGLGGRHLHGEIAESALALYTIHLDPASLSATASLKAQRAGAQTDDVYELSISRFLRSHHFRIDRVSRDADSVNLTYTITHPFAAPTDLDAPATAVNRIDLGISGRVLFMVDSLDPSGDTYFDELGTGGGRVIANTDVVTNADGYYTPAGLLSLPNIVANTFPYKVLVDELADSRTDGVDGSPRSNGGSPQGNFDPALGWTRSTIGVGNDEWTGFGYLHHGQAVTSTIELDLDSIQNMDYVFDAAILAKYIDPRGGTTTLQKRANRLPAATPDLAQFGYRAMHAALDVASIEYVGESGGFIPNALSASELRFRVVDWDARATETTFPDLSEDTTSASTVPVDASGVPTVSVSIPHVLGTNIVTFAQGALQDDDSAYGGDVDVDSGMPGDALFYAESVTNLASSGQGEGTFTGMVRAVDVEDTQGGSQPVALMDDLTPLSTNLPRPVAYQAFTVVLDAPGDVPTLTLSTPANVESGTTTTLTVESADDINNDPITVQIDWDNDGTFEAQHVINPPYTTPIIYNSTVPKYNNTSLTNSVRTIPVRFTDGVLPTPLAYAPALTFTLGPNRAPVITGAPVLTEAALFSPATFSLEAGTATIVDPEGDPIILKVTNNIDSDVVTSATFPVAGLGPYTNPSTPTVDFTLWATDALHNETGAGPVNGTPFAPVTGTINIPCTPSTQTYQWTFTSGNDGWTEGHNFTPQVFNSDNAPGNSRFYRCSSKAYQAAGGFSGGCITTGPWALFGCGWNDDDYGAQCDNSMIGPTMNLSAYTDVDLVFNSSKNGRNNAVPRYRVWISTDNGLNWDNSNIVYDTTKTGTGVVAETNVTVSLEAYAGMSDLRLRFQFEDTTNSSFSAGSGTFAGWSVDNIRVLTCS